ncbi:hypothetical protein NKDENANG_03417 [Candidatus Entotheonellaceae bacterium PAL068K]
MGRGTHKAAWPLLGLGLVLLSSVCLAPEASLAERWQEKRGQHFQVFYRGDAAFATTVMRWAEQYYTQIRLDLGLNHVVNRDRVPWLWDQRCRIYLYPDRRSYLHATGAPAWSGGRVQYRERAVYSFMGADAFLEKTLPHELAHILFREYVGFDNTEVPRWLDEGVAQYAEVGRRDKALAFMVQGLSRGIYVPFDRFNRFPVNRVPGNVARLFYAQAVSLVHFFLAHYGSRRFIALCSNLRDGYRLGRALSFATAGQVQSLGDLEAVWRRFMHRLS